MLNKYETDISINKEVLNNLPKNNIKNQKKYQEKLKELTITYNDILKHIEKEMHLREEKYQDFKINELINITKTKKENLYNNLYILDNTTPYEKSNLSKLLYALDNFFDNDLESVNNIIKQIILVFKNINIELTIKDFNYTYYVNLYMTKFLENTTQEELKLCFEDIYFKSPTLFKQISLNFKYLYYTNIKKFLDYYKTLENNMLENTSSKEIYNKFFNLNDEYLKLVLEDKYTISNKLINGEFNLKNYTKENIINTFKLFINKDILEENLINYKDIILKLLKSLLEYQGYLKYSFIIDDLKTKYNDKDKYKNISLNKYKELSKKQNNLFKLNKKINRLLYGRFKNINKANLLITTSINIINELEKLYIEYEESLFLETFLNLDIDVNIFDLLNISLGSYTYLIKIFKQEYSDLTNEEIELEINKYIRFIRETKFTVLNHYLVNDSNELDYIIVDKYNLLGLDLNKDSLKNDLDNLILNARIILNYYEIKEKINLDNINYLINIKK